MKSIFIVCSSSLLLASTGLSQDLFWRAPVDGSGNRNGSWSTAVPNWSNSVVGPFLTPWLNPGIANFVTPEGGNVLIVGQVISRGIRADSGGTFTIVGAPLNLTGPNPEISVANTGSGMLVINSTISATLSTVVKTGPGSLFLGGAVSVKILNIQDGSVSLSGNNRTNAVGITNTGTLVMNGADTVATYTQGTAGILAGSAVLTAADGATLNGGIVSGSLSGNITTTADVVIPGTVSGASLSVNGGILTLEGISKNNHIKIAAGASLIDTSGGFDGSEVSIQNFGKLVMGSNDMSHDYVQEGNAELAGNYTLTVDKAAFLRGGTVSGSLSGPAFTSGSVVVSGSIGGGTLQIQSGALTLDGTSTNSTVTIFAGASLVDAKGGLATSAVVTNAGTLNVNSNDTISKYTQNGVGEIRGSGILTVTGAANINMGTISGHLLADTTISGPVRVSGSIGGGALMIQKQGAVTLEGMLSSREVTIFENGSLDDSGRMGEQAAVTNFGSLLVRRDDTIGTYVQNPDALLGGDAALTVTGGAALHGGAVSGNLSANTTIRGDVLISGSQSGGHLQVETGTLTLTGTAVADTGIAKGATLRGTGSIMGDVRNLGNLETGSTGDKMLEISGNLVTQGTVKLSLGSQMDFERIHVGGTAIMAGGLQVINNGEGLSAGEEALVIDAAAYEGAFTEFSAQGFSNGVLFDNGTGRLIGLAGGTTGSSRNYLNLNQSQTNIYLSLFEDAVDIGVQNVTTGNDAGVSDSSFQAMKSTATMVSTPNSIEITSGLSNGDAQLVRALNAATFTTPGSIFQPVINQLSPEVHRGMADYTEQALRSHVRNAVDAAPVSQSGKTQAFATVHSSVAGVESSATRAGYDTAINGVTTGMRYDIDPRTRIGGMLGVDDGSIKGSLIDTEAQGVVVGAFGQYLVHEASKTTLTGSLSYGAFGYDATRHSFEGNVHADNIDSNALELAVGVRSVVFEKNGFRVIPNAALRYLTGNVDGFVEDGSGVGLDVGSQNIDSLLLDLAMNVEYQPMDRITLVGNIGYTNDFKDDSNSVSAKFAASGSLGSPFSVSAPGIDDEAVVLALGAYYDITQNIQAGLTYRCDFRFDSKDAQTVGIGCSFGF